MIPQSKSDFTDYCLRALGHPVIDINIETTQIDDRIDDALQLYKQYHYDAIEHDFILVQLSQDDIDNGYITTDENVTGVVNISTPDSGLSSSWLTNTGQLYKDIAYDLSYSSTNSVMVSDYAAFAQYTEFINSVLGITHRFEYHQHMNRIKIHTDWTETFKVDDYVLVEVYKVIDPNLFPNIWNDEWLKNYSTALIGRQWGNNLSKYDGVQLPGGITLNGEQIYDKYNTMATELKEELDNKYTMPVDFIVG